MSRFALPLAACLFGAATISACEGKLLPAPGRGVLEARIIGTVRGPTGEPVSGVPVSITRVLLADGTGTTTFGRCTGLVTPNVLTSQTDGAGRFEAVYKSIRTEYLCFVFDVSASVGGKLVTGRAEVDSVLLGGTGVDSLPVTITVR